MVEQIRVKIGDFILPINPESVSVTFEKRIVQHEIPGRDGDIIQDLGTKSKIITFSGKLMTTRQNTLEDSDYQTALMLQKFEEKDVLDLTFPIRTSSMEIGATKVVIKNLSISDEAGRFDYKDYSITCVEWRPVEVKKNLVSVVNKDTLDQLQTIIKNKAYGGFG